MAYHPQLLQDDKGRIRHVQASPGYKRFEAMFSYARPEQLPDMKELLETLKLTRYNHEYFAVFNDEVIKVMEDRIKELENEK